MPQARTSVRNWGIFSQPTQKAPRKNKKKAGNDLLSHTVTHAVPSTRKSLTTEFGMGSGVASLLLSPARLLKLASKRNIACFKRFLPHFGWCSKGVGR